MKKIELYKKIIILIISSTIIVSCFIIINAIQPKESHFETYIENDPISDTKIQYIDQEPEGNNINAPKVTFFGFNIFNEMGFTIDQQDEIKEQIVNYFPKDTTIELSYKKNSFTYEENKDHSSNYNKVNVIFVDINSNKEYLIKINDTDNKIKVDISE